jgi:predicted amidohydrolase YtcJ
MCICCRIKSFGFSKSQERREFFASDTPVEQVCLADGNFELITRAPPATPADLIIENAIVLTLEAENPLLQTIAIGGDKLWRVSNDRRLELLRRQSVKVIDAAHRTIVLGSHFTRGSFAFAQEVSWSGVPSLTLALRMLEERASRILPPHWIQVSQDWGPNQFQEKRLPTLEEISIACGETPCFVMKLCDCAFVNRSGLTALGWTRKTSAPKGGLIARNGKGDPIGMLIPAAELNNLLAVFSNISELSNIYGS